MANQGSGFDVITYSLRHDRTNSDSYYAQVANFTDDVLAEGGRLAGPVIRAYRGFLGESGNPQATDTPEEHLLEFLMLGTLWNQYADDAAGLHPAARQVLAGLAELRRQGGPLKPGVDFLRGILSTLFLEPVDDPAAVAAIEPTPSHLERLLGWLEATGEYHQEVRQLQPWQQFLAGLPGAEATDHLATAITFAAWFELNSLSVLGPFTANVEQFLAERLPHHRWREDLIACGRRRVEYHLNMVGAEIMNRAFRPGFEERPVKVVLLPGCMRRRPPGECRAEPAPMGERCTGCVKGCRVHQLTRLGQRYGFGVFMLSHESSFGRGATPDAFRNLAIVGIACATNLLSGGWKAQQLGLPAQCVLLDYAGCRQHWDWDDDGIPTDINFAQLQRILNIQPT